MLFGSKNGRFSAVSASPEPVRSGHRAIVLLFEPIIPGWHPPGHGKAHYRTTILTNKLLSCGVPRFFSP